MRLGFLTACLPSWSLAEVVSWAGAHGFGALEVGAWPVDDPLPDHPAHVDVRALDERGARVILERASAAGVTLSALACYSNTLDGDRAARRRRQDHLRACIDAAALLGVSTVGTFVGRDVSRTVAENLRDAEHVLPPLIEHASAAGVQIVIENCLMSGWHPDGYPANLAYSPELWQWLVGLGLRLNFDPSHLPGIGIDPVRAATMAAGLVGFVQAKDVEVLPGRIDRVGYVGNAVDRSNPWDHVWWRYRLPGLGQVDWRGVLSALRDGGYDGVVSIEHEDPTYTGSPDAVTRGLLVACDTLAPLLG
jgi:sugar phosphate isomerase/epimerase